MTGSPGLYYCIGVALMLALGNGMAKEQRHPRILPVAIAISVLAGVLVGYVLNVFAGLVSASATMR